MPGYVGLRDRLIRAALLAALAVAGAFGCGGASPSVRVLGVQEARRAPSKKLLVFVEVVNPTQRDITLSRLEYRVRASSWFKSEGAVSISRHVAAGSSAVVEIPVPVTGPADADGTIPYTLEGKLFAREDRVERSWDVEVHGALGAAAGGEAGPVRVTVVGD